MGFGRIFLQAFEKYDTNPGYKKFSHLGKIFYDAICDSYIPHKDDLGRCPQNHPQNQKGVKMYAMESEY